MPARAAPDIYESAKLPGGKHHGLLRQLDGLGPRQLDRSIRSYRSQIEVHRAKLAEPRRIVQDWDSRSEEYKTGLLTKWRGEIKNFEEKIEIIERHKHEHGK